MRKHKIYQDKNIKRSVGRGVWTILSYLPLFIRGPIVRRLFSVDSHLPSNLVFKKAETQSELEQAFQVAYDSYAERGLVSESEAGLRLTKFHVLPSTSILVAKLDDKVIATVSVICDSNLGLPLEKLFDVQFLRKDSKRIAEISTLAISRHYRARRGKLLLALCKYMYEYTVRVLNVDAIVATVHPEVSDFYRCILMFEDIEKGVVKSYNFVQDAAARGHFLRFNEASFQKGREMYSNLPENKNVFEFIYQASSLPNFSLPESLFYKSSDFTFSPTMLEYFFGQRSNILGQLTKDEKLTMSNSYFYPEYQAIFGNYESLNSTFKRSFARFAINCPVSYHFAGNDHVYRGTALEVSRQGLKVKLDGKHVPNQAKEITMMIGLSPTVMVNVGAQIIWDKSDASQVGILIDSSMPKSWHEFIDHLENDLLSRIKQTDKRPKSA